MERYNYVPPQLYKVLCLKNSADAGGGGCIPQPPSVSVIVSHIVKYYAFVTFLLSCPVLSCPVLVVLFKPQPAIAKLRLHASMMSICLSVCLLVCLSICLSPNCKKTRFSQKTKQFRAIVSIDDL